MTSYVSSHRRYRASAQCRHVHLHAGVLACGVYYGKAAREERSHRAIVEREIIDLLELQNIRNKIVGTLPYGLQKRVELARQYRAADGHAARHEDHLAADQVARPDALQPVDHSGGARLAGAHEGQVPPVARRVPQLPARRDQQGVRIRGVARGLAGAFPRPYPDLGHAVDWEEAKRVSTCVSDAAVETMLCVASGAAIADRVRALESLDIDAIWWRDEASYTRPDALLRGLEKEVLPRLR